ADPGRRGEVQGRVELRLGHEAHAQPAGDAALRLLPLPHTPAVLVDQLAHRHAQGQFDQAGLVDVPAEAVELGAVAAGVAPVLRVGGDAHRLEPVGPAVDDVGDAGDGLDVVDDGGLAERPLHGGERRLDPRPGPLALQALDQAGLLPADVGAGPAVDVDIEV